MRNSSAHSFEGKINIFLHDKPFNCSFVGAFFHERAALIERFESGAKIVVEHGKAAKLVVRRQRAQLFFGKLFATVFVCKLLQVRGEQRQLARHRRR